MGILINNKNKEVEMTTLTDERKAELDNYSEEEIIFLWNAFTQQEIDYLEEGK